MADQIGPIILGIGSATAAILGAVALLMKARAKSGQPVRLLERLRDWIESQTVDGEPLVNKMPPSLRADLDRELDEEGTA